MNKVSDYKLAKSAIWQVCKVKGVPFKDVSVSFVKNESGFSNNALQVLEGINIGQTLFNVVQAYLGNSDSIYGESIIERDELNEVLTHQAAIFRRCLYGHSKRRRIVDSDEPHLQRLYQRPLPWMLLKNIVCPAMKTCPNNMLVVSGTSPVMDFARYFSSGEATSENVPEAEFIFVNDDVTCEEVLTAAILVAAIEGMGLSATETVKAIYSSPLAEVMNGTIDMVIGHPTATDEFRAALFSMTGVRPSDFAKGGDYKTAQSFDQPYASPMAFWYNGLTEKMLGAVRGSDWTTYKHLNHYIEEFWDDVEDLKSKLPQGEGVNFNDLLRLKQLQFTEQQDVSKPLQDMLSHQRIW